MELKRSQLEALSYRELQAKAKELGIKANQKKCVLLEALLGLENDTVENDDDNSCTSETEIVNKTVSSEVKLFYPFYIQICSQIFLLVSKM